MNELKDKDLPKSKSKIKREMIALQELGARLVLLNSQKLKELSLPAELFDALQEAKKMSSHGAKRRQLQYIGRLMRDIEDPTYIRDFLLKIESKHQRSTAIHHMLESWRERLIEDNAALTEFIAEFPLVDRQRLRQLIASAKKERIYGKPLGAGRALFRFIHLLQQEKEK